MKKIIMPLLSLCLFGSCSRPSESTSDADTTAATQHVSPTPAGIGPLSVLDVDNIKTYPPGDTTVIFPENPAADSLTEPNAFKNDTRVSRVEEGLEFRLNSGETKLLKENKKTDGDDYTGYAKNACRKRHCNICNNLMFLTNNI